MIELKNITKTYKNGKNKTVEAIKGISTVFPDKGMVFIVGKSGGGKSTLLNILGGLDTYDGGDFLIDDVSTKNFTRANWDSYRNHYVGFVFQDHRLVNGYNVHDNVEFALALQREKGEKSNGKLMHKSCQQSDDGKAVDTEHSNVQAYISQDNCLSADNLNLGGKTDDEKIEFALKTVGMEERSVLKLSGGQRQRVAIARALVKDYQVILADEPTGNLDAVTAREIFELLKTIAKTKLVIVVTHDVGAANLYADMAIAVNLGKIVETAAKDGFTPSLKLHIAKEETTAQALKESLYECPNGSSGLTIKSKTDGQSTVDKLHFTKSRLSNRVVWKIIGKSIKKRIVRIVTTSLICILSFLMISSVLKIAAFTPYAVQERLMKHESASILKKVKYTEDVYGSKSDVQIEFDADDVKAITRDFPQNKFYKATTTDIRMDYDLGRRLSAAERFYYNDTIAKKCEIDEAGLKAFGFDLLAGEYPNSETWAGNDVLIPQYVFEIFQLCGYKSDETTVTGIKTYQDIIGKVIDNYRIRGVIETNVDTARFLKVKNYALNPTAAKKPNKNFIYVCREQYFQSSSYEGNFHTTVYSAISKTPFTSFNTLMYKNVDSDNRRMAEWVLNSGKYEFADGASAMIWHFYNVIVDDKNAGALTFFIFALFLTISSIMLIGFFATSIKETREEIGILKCVGASNGDILSIYMIQAGLIALGLFVVSLLLFAFVCVPILPYYNPYMYYFPIKIFTFSFADSAVLFGIISAITLLASIPLFSLTRKTPMEILTDM